MAPIVERVSERLLEQGAKATLLVGSHARGDARPDSDVDLFAIGDGPRERAQVVDERTVSVHWFTPEEIRRRLASPSAAIVSVCGLAEAVVVDDPMGVGAELRQEARDWSWERIAAEADAFAADEIVGFAEYAHKLVGALDAGRTLDAAAVTAEGALRLGQVVAIRRRVRVESENGLWEAIADAAPPEWGTALRGALRAEGEAVDVAARCVLRLFALIAADVHELLGEEDEPIVEHALATARRRI